MGGEEDFRSGELQAHLNCMESPALVHMDTAAAAADIAAAAADSSLGADSSSGSMMLG